MRPDQPVETMTLYTDLPCDISINVGSGFIEGMKFQCANQSIELLFIGGFSMLLPRPNS